MPRTLVDRRKLKMCAEYKDCEQGEVLWMAMTGSLLVRGRNISQTGRPGERILSAHKHKDVTVHLHMHVTMGTDLVVNELQ
jgi:hypothetical protein